MGWGERTAIRRGLASAVVVALVAAATACSGGSSDAEDARLDETLAAIEGLSGTKRQERLQALAQEQGGELSLYTSMGADRVPDLIDAFEEEFDLDVAVYRANSEAIVPRLLEERSAGFQGADVVRVNGLAMTNLAGEGILADYASPEAPNLIEGAVADGWTADSFSTFGVTWNTELVPEGEQPTSWADLADPRWKGRVAIEAGDVDLYAALLDHWTTEEGMSREDAERLFETLARNALVVRGHTLLGQLMAAGEIAVAPNYTSRVEILRKEGAPVAWQPAVEPLFPEPQGVGLVDGARHPAAAILFYDWLLSDGQEILITQEVDSAREDLVEDAGVERRVIDIAAIAADYESWSDRYDKLLRLGREVEG